MDEMDGCISLYNFYSNRWVFLLIDTSRASRKSGASPGYQKHWISQADAWISGEDQWPRPPRFIYKNP